MKICKQLLIIHCLVIFLLSFCVETVYAFPSIKLNKVKFNQSKKAELVEVLLNNDPKYVTFYQANPARYIIELRKSYYPRFRSSIKVNSKYIKNIKVKQYRYDKVRIIIELNVLAPISSKVINAFDGKTLVFSFQKEDAPTKFVKASPKKKTKPKKITKKTISPIVSIDPNNADSAKKRIAKVKKPKREKALKDSASKQDSSELSESDLASLFGMGDNESGIPSEGIIVDSNVSGQVSKFSLNGSLKNETAYRLQQPHQFSKVKNILNLKASGDLTDSFSYAVSGRISYDSVFDLNDNYNDNVKDDQRLIKDLRDTYVDIGIGNLDLRLGKQQIVWGQAVGLFFADIVNPRDLREFILPELEQIRIPVLAANAEYFYDNMYFQLIFIPYPEFDKIGKAGSEFDYYTSFTEGPGTIVLNEAQEPDDDLDNSEVGARFSVFTEGWDLSLFYLYDYHNTPVYYRTITLPSTTTFDPEYERVHRFGSTFSKEVNDFIFKGEFIYSDNMFYTSSDTTDADGIETSPQFEWLIGVDYTFAKKLETNFQLMQNIIIDHSNTMNDNQFTTSASIWLKTGFFDDRLEPELFFVSRLDKADYMLRPKLSYNYNDYLKFILGADIFRGENDGDFGRFDDSDRVYLEILYDF